MGRKIFYLLLGFIISCGSFAQNKTQIQVDTILPKKVLTTFNKMYPQGNTEEWTVSGDTFVITYFVDNEWIEVVIGRSGNWLSTSTIIDFDVLPAPVQTAFTSGKYKDKEILLIKIEEKQGLKKKIRDKTFLIYIENYKKEEVVLKYRENGEELN